VWTRACLTGGFFGSNLVDTYSLEVPLTPKKVKGEALEKITPLAEEAKKKIKNWMK